ncbi:MAG TPA: 30S ribosomal protein S16 [Dehalococcoidia bacterium]|nr:30S ribosomal protein S16 [Dehalococcoidia bacterium]
MLRIRLRRVGKKGNPSYRIVVADSRAPRDGAYVEWIGNYDPMADPPAVTIKEDRAQAWLSQGAQPSDAVARILDWKGILTRTPKQRTTATAVEEEPEVAAPAPAPVAEAPTPEPEADDTTAVAEEAAEEPVAEVVAEETAEEPVAEVAAEESAEEISGEAESADDIDSEDTGEETSKDTPEEESSE